MKSVKLIGAYPEPRDIYQQEHVPMAIANLHGKAKMAATKILQPPRGEPQFYSVAEESDGGKETLAHASKISSGGVPSS